MDTYLKEIEKHLLEKQAYSRAYIDRVIGYLKKNEDLAHEFYIALPKNTILDTYIDVKGVSLRTLGARTMLSRSAIYIVLSRLREEDKDVSEIIEEELAYLHANKIY
jgi:hypothetical protein